MATKVKPSRLKVSWTPQVWQVPVYVDEDTFQWWAGWWGWNVKSFTLSSTSDLTTAQEAYDWYDDGNVAIIVYNDKEYLFDYATAGNAYWSVANEEAYDTVSGTWMRKASLQLALSSGTVTGVTALNISVNDFSVLRTDKDYGTPYTPQYNWSPATKKYVDDSVSTLMGLGKFLSLWDATTWLPVSFPLSTPYTYTTWDYYLVETVSSATPPVNYKPTGSSYTGTASSTTESEELEVWDIYIYDGTTWLLQLNHWKTVSFSEIAWDPYDNTDLSDALTAKQDELVSGVNIRTINWTSVLWNWDITTPVWPTYSAWTWISINSSDVISNSQPWPAVSSSAPVSPSQWAMWYDTTNDELKTYDGSSRNGIGGGDAKVFEISDLTSAANLTIATAAYTYGYTNKKCAILRYSGGNYVYARWDTTSAYFSRTYWYWAVSNWTWAYIRTLKLTVSSWSVTAITDNTNQINISSSAPSSSTTNNTITLVI